MATDGRRDEPIRMLLDIIGLAWLDNLEEREIPGYSQKDYISNYTPLNPRLDFSE